MNRPQTTYLDLVRACDSFPRDSGGPKSYYELYLPYDSNPHGYLLPEIVHKMPWTNNFRVRHEVPRSVVVLDTSDGNDVANAVNAAFQELITICIDRDLFHVLDRQHSELFAILGANYPVQIERFATSLFGITACGAHLVAYVEIDDSVHLWIPRRGMHLYSSPGMLDTTVAGGVKAGTSPLETIVEEAAEEASLPEDLIRAGIRARGAITCMCVTGEDWPGEKGLVLPDVIYVYDIELPEDVLPAPNDDEVVYFTLMSLADVQSALLSKQFKPDSAAVLVEFLIRHGIITAENEPDYVEIITHLHRRLPFRIAPQR